MFELFLDDRRQVGVLPLGAVAFRLADHRAERNQFVINLGVIPLDNCNVGEGLTRDEVDVAISPVLDLSQGLGELVLAVHPQSIEYNVFDRLREMFLRHLRELLGHKLECFPVVLSFPRRLCRRRQGMHEGVHITKGDIIFFVPKGRRQNHIGIIGSGIHAKVEVYQKVQFADGFFVMPFNFIYQVFCRLLIPHNVVACPKEVLERQFMSPHAGSDKIAAIHGEHLQLVFRGIDIVNGKIQLAISEPIGNPAFYLVIGLAAGVDGFLVKLHRVLFVDLRKKRQPSQPNCQRVHVSRVVESGEFLSPRGPLGVERHVVVFPLAGMEIPQRG